VVGVDQAQVDLARRGAATTSAARPGRGASSVSEVRAVRQAPPGGAQPGGQRAGARCTVVAIAASPAGPW